MFRVSVFRIPPGVAWHRVPRDAESLELRTRNLKILPRSESFTGLSIKGGK